MVCQEKNIILEFFLIFFCFFIRSIGAVLVEFMQKYELQTNSAVFYSDNFISWRVVGGLFNGIQLLFLKNDHS